jgi:chaperonin GroES
MSNTSGIRPLEFKVLVLPMAVETKTESGIILTASTVEREQAATVQGTVVEMSPYAFDEFPKTKPAVGDKVLIAKYGGQVHRGKDGLEYRLLNDKDILAILE